MPSTTIVLTPINGEHRAQMKPISGFAGYFVTDDGRVWSEMGRGRFLRPALSSNGYLCVILRHSGKAVSKRINRLVLEAFIANPGDKQEANHINGIKTDNRLENLEWTTPAENLLHACAMGLCRNIRQVQQWKDGVLIKTFGSTREVSRYGFNRRKVHSVAIGGRNHYHGYEWKFADEPTVEG